MLFNSYVFIFIFLPATLAVYYTLKRIKRPSVAIGALVLASIIFYGAWNPHFVALILASILVNFLVCAALSQALEQDTGTSRLWLILGIAFNLLLLGYFKYMNFMLDNIALITKVRWHINIILPLGISFFTFQQIAYIVDTYRGKPVDRNILRYALFVTFFPQLIAGPIVHHQEIMPQFAKRHGGWQDLAVGLSFFVIGLGKKVILADNIAPIASSVFDAASQGHLPDPGHAWLGALAYGLQIYFDFSGYSDMAIGLARLFGIRLPMNFASPYKSGSIIEFWRRWHITLSRFLRDYLYIPLGGNRQGAFRKTINVFITMMLGALWHGAAWTFLLWGLLHSLFLAINMGWQRLARNTMAERFFHHGFARLLTLLCVIIAWVPFRADGLKATALMYQGMSSLGTHSAAIPFSASPIALIVLGIAVLIALFAPNTAQIMHRYNPAIPTPGYPDTIIKEDEQHTISWRPNMGFALALGCLLWVCIILMSRPSPFIYFQF